MLALEQPPSLNLAISRVTLSTVEAACLDFAGVCRGNRYVADCIDVTSDQQRTSSFENLKNLVVYGFTLEEQISERCFQLWAQ